MADSGNPVPEKHEAGPPGDVVLITGQRHDWGTVKTRRALKRLHFDFIPRARIDMRPFSQQDEASVPPVNVDEYGNDFGDETVSIASTVLLTPTSSVEAQPPTSTPTSSSTSGRSWLHTPHHLHRN